APPGSDARRGGASAYAGAGRSRGIAAGGRPRGRPTALAVPGACSGGCPGAWAGRRGRGSGRRERRRRWGGAGLLCGRGGEPQRPPGLRMALALTEVQESLRRNLALNKPGPAHGQLQRLAGCIESGLACVKQEQEEVRRQVEEIARVAATLQEDTGSRKQ